MGMPIKTGICRIQSQHNLLTSLYQETVDILNEGRMTEELFRQFLGTLKGYIVIHFGTELKLFELLSDVQAQEHNISHETFYIWLEDVLFQYFMDPTANGGELGIINHIHIWTESHNNLFEKDFLEYLDSL